MEILAPHVSKHANMVTCLPIKMICNVLECLNEADTVIMMPMLICPHLLLILLDDIMCVTNDICQGYLSCSGSVVNHLSFVICLSDISHLSFVSVYYLSVACLSIIAHLSLNHYSPLLIRQ